MNKIIKGQKLFIVDYNKMVFYKNDPEVKILKEKNKYEPYTSECEVVLSGRKYIHIKIPGSVLTIKFYKDSFKEVSQYTPKKVLYKNRKQYEDYRKRKDIERSIKNLFNYINTNLLNKYTLEDMLKIKEIINEINKKYV